MNKRDLIDRTTDLLQQKNVRKRIRAQIATFHISDDEGNTGDFQIKKDATAVLLTTEDVGEVLEAVLEVITDSIKSGESVTLPGFGSFKVHERAKRAVRHPDTGEMVDIEAHYTTKFSPGTDLKLAAKIYDLSTKEFESESFLDEEGDSYGD